MNSRAWLAQAASVRPVARLGQQRGVDQAGEHGVDPDAVGTRRGPRRRG